MPPTAPRTDSPFNSIVKIGIGLLLALAVALLVFTLVIKLKKPAAAPQPSGRTGSSLRAPGSPLPHRADLLRRSV